MSEKTKKCPKCMSEVDQKATICPKCQSKIWWIGWWTALVVIIIGLVIINTITPESSSEPWVLEACTYSQIEITNMLKSPASAIHPLCSVGEYIKTGNRHKFESYVDSKNWFWAIMRTKYSCTVILDWTPEYSIKCNQF